ncbi:MULTISPECIES: PA2169 family four-helix-bundle protein [unclassified Flavobacterium]|uniref:PA2169 family four-helix-bundle protein n=1 Tax=unclassified Flavobacterium TaxID=196869 RepID=UPI003F8F1208
MNKITAIDVLNSFIIINNDRIIKYKAAAQDIKNYSLKKAFTDFQKTSQQCKLELSKEIIKLGGTPVEDKGFSNTILTLWSTIKNSLIYKDLTDIIINCERNEDKVMQKYYDTIYNNLGLLNDNQQIMLSEQYFSINTDHYEIKSLKNSLLAVTN